MSNTMETDSWEVRAFAEDVSGNGTHWPPSFYACSFCRREFRTAQALGGHMNVHRRERAAHKALRGPFSSTRHQALDVAPDEKAENLLQRHRPGSSSNPPFPFKSSHVVNHFSGSVENLAGASYCTDDMSSASLDLVQESISSNSSSRNSSRVGDIEHHQHRRQSQNFLHEPAFNSSQDSNFEMDNLTRSSGSVSFLQPHCSTRCPQLSGPAQGRLLHDSTEAAATTSYRTVAQEHHHHHQRQQDQSLDLELRLGHMSSP